MIAFYSKVDHPQITVFQSRDTDGSHTIRSP